MKKTFLMLAAFWALTLQAQEQKNPVPQISVTGEGKIKIVPDHAVVTVGFQNSGKDAKEVKTLNDEVVDKVIKFLKKSGVPATDYKTNNVSLYKSYDYEKKKYNFQANQTLSITLKDLTKYDEIMMGLNDAGVNSIQGVEFKSSKMEDYERDARKKAMVNAKQKAQDDLEAKMDAASYAKSIREKLGFTQKELSERIMVPLETIRNWEQGKRYPTGPARLLLKILDKSPKLVLQVI